MRTDSETKEEVGAPNNAKEGGGGGGGSLCTSSLSH